MILDTIASHYLILFEYLHFWKYDLKRVKWKQQITINRSNERSKNFVNNVWIIKLVRKAQLTNNATKWLLVSFWLNATVIINLLMRCYRASHGYGLTGLQTDSWMMLRWFKCWPSNEATNEPEQRSSGADCLMWHDALWKQKENKVPNSNTQHLYR